MRVYDIEVYIYLRIHTHTHTIYCTSNYHYLPRLSRQYSVYCVRTSHDVHIILSDADDKLLQMATRWQIPTDDIGPISSVDDDVVYGS